MIDRLRDLGIKAAPLPPEAVDEEEEGLREAADTNLRVQTLVAKLKLFIDMLEPYKKKFKEATSNEEQRKLQGEVERIYKLLRADLLTLDQELKDMRVALDRAEEMEEHDKEMLGVNIAAFYRLYEQTLQRGQRVYSELRLISKQQLVRKVRMLDAQLPQGEIEEMVDNNPLAFQDLITKKTMGGISHEMRNQAQDIMEKCEGIKRLQSSVKELLEMLKDISKIVQMQGERINSIAGHVSAAKDYMAEATSTLIKAKAHQSSFRCVA